MNQTISSYATGVTTENRVLSDTYRLLSYTLIFSAFTAFISYQFAPAIAGILNNLLVLLIPYLALTYMVHKNANKPSALIWVFALTGWLGFTMGPMLYYVLQVKGFGPVLNALASTGLVFLVSSAVGKKYPGTLKFGGILMTGILVAFVLSILNYFIFGSSFASMLISGAMAVLSAGLIAWQTASIVHGGERNYIIATVTLFVMLWNIFSFFLQFFISSDD